MRILRGDTTHRDRTEAPEPCAGWRRAPRAATPVGGARRARCRFRPSIFQKRFLRRSRIRRRSRFPKNQTKRRANEAPRTVRDSRKFFFDSNVMRGFFLATRYPENAFFIHRRTTLTPLLFPSPKHRRFVIHDERERHVGFGVPTHRRRVFIVASLHGPTRARAFVGQTARCAGECRTTGGLCYACFHVEPEEAEPSAAAACVDFTEKRRPPLLHEIESSTPRNVRRLCVVREDKSKEGREAAASCSAPTTSSA